MARTAITTLQPIARTPRHSSNSEHFAHKSSDEPLGATLLRLGAMSNAKRFVYIIQSIRNQGAYYTGITSDLDARLTAHNAGASHHTAAQRPWKKLVVVEFDEEEPAVLFEQYLKTGSGREFARRHFRQRVSR